MSGTAGPVHILLLRAGADTDATGQLLAAMPGFALIGVASSGAEAERLVAASWPGAEFWARSQGRYRRVLTDELDWVEAERYVRLHTAPASFLHHESLGAVAARSRRIPFAGSIARRSSAGTAPARSAAGPTG